jgi:hypothetical protein
MTATARPLRSVKRGDKPVTKAATKTVSKRVVQAAKDGNPRELLAAMRDRIAVAVEDPNTPARDLASLTKRLMEVVRDIEALDARAAEEAKENAEHPDEAWDTATL